MPEHNDALGKPNDSLEDLFEAYVRAYAEGSSIWMDEFRKRIQNKARNAVLDEIHTKFAAAFMGDEPDRYGSTIDARTVAAIIADMRAGK